MKYSGIAGERRLAAYRRALGPTIRSALEEPNVVEVMVNPDGTIWIDRLWAAGPARASACRRRTPCR